MKQLFDKLGREERHMVFIACLCKAKVKNETLNADRVESVLRRQSTEWTIPSDTEQGQRLVREREQALFNVGMSHYDKLMKE
jgi:hypothetical protein